MLPCIYLLFYYSLFFSQLLQAAPPRRYLPGDIDFLSRIDITKKFRDFKRRFLPTEEDEIINDDLDEKCVSTILPFYHFRLSYISLSVFTVCEIRQVTCKILCLLFGFIRNEARQSLIIILIKPTSCLYVRRLCTNE